MELGGTKRKRVGGDGERCNRCEWNGSFACGHGQRPGHCEECRGYSILANMAAAARSARRVMGESVKGYTILCSCGDGRSAAVVNLHPSLALLFLSLHWRSKCMRG